MAKEKNNLTYKTIRDVIENPGQRVHFIGVGGVSMYSLASVSAMHSLRVSGSDVEETARTASLRRLGVEVAIGHGVINSMDKDLVVYSHAISEDNPELLGARRLDIPTVSRAEFLALAMSAAGYTGFSTSNTGFEDDDEIPTDYKGYIAAAKAFGIIDGIETDTGLRFYPSNQITRCEAAVILSRLTGITGGAVSVFANEAIPAWAEGAMVGLYNAGILRGMGDGTLGAYTPITRAAAAQLVSGIIGR